MTKALKDGAVTSDLVKFDFCGPKVANQGFKPMVRERAFDAGELAIGTFLEAKTYGKPVTLLPAVVMGRFQHQTALRSTARGRVRPGRPRGQAHRHPLLHADHRHLGARHLQARIRRRPEQGHLGVQRRRPPRRVQRSAERRAHAARLQEGRPDAARRRDRRRDPRRRDPERAARRAPDSEPEGCGARLVPQVQHGSGQSPVLRRQGPRRRAAGRGASRSSAC